MSALITISENSDFTIHNLPLGVFHLKTETLTKARCCTILGDTIIDLASLVDNKVLEIDLNENPFKTASLNEFIALG